MTDDIAPPSRLTPVSLADADYGAIEQAVMETARGRWFLDEYARRNRHADTVKVLDAIGRLESAVAAPRTSPGIERVRMDIREMALAIARTKAEIAAIKPEGADAGSGHFEDASVELDAIVQATATATGDILSAAETIQEIAWTLREMGAEGEVCDLIDTKTTDIYTACSFQDITGQRTRKVIGVLRFLEDRIDSMMAIWGESGVAAAPPPVAEKPEASLLNGPAKPGEGLVQHDVDMMLDDGLFADAAPAAVEDEAVLVEPEPLPPVIHRLVEDVPVTARATAAAALST
ncbi:MAG: chemotaxis protein, partial [Phreatobacter sp.]|nr:chemotaxis protein [Phreatobacter sp.]